MYKYLANIAFFAFIKHQCQDSLVCERIVLELIEIALKKHKKFAQNSNLCGKIK